jgi:phenylacetate-coenzyme A ligase PaaK-like adenylate-forming protein
MRLYFNQDISTRVREDMNALIDEWTKYTNKYANDHFSFSFFRKWFRKHVIQLAYIHSHQELFELSVISGNFTSCRELEFHFHYVKERINVLLTGDRL